MVHESVNAKAERLSSQRARALPSLALLFVAQHATYYLGTGVGTGDRPIDNILLISWLAISVVMLLLLTTGGGWFHSRKVRELAFDEATRAHRDAALRLGFTASMITCLIIYLISLSEPLGGREAVHLVMSIGIATALVRFALLEWRAHRDG